MRKFNIHITNYSRTKIILRVIIIERYREEINIRACVVRDCRRCKGSGEISTGILESGFGFGKLSKICPVCDGKGMVKVG